MVVSLTACGWAAVHLSGPPAPLGDDAPDTVFAAGRAMPHVRAIAQKAHPMGSAEHARVREYLVAELQRLGLTVERQRTTALRQRGGSRGRGVVLAGAVENLMVRLPGTASTGAVMLAGHYDSVAAGPGAADDASAVAAILETIRVLKSGPPLRNDLIALFTDGEEDGLLGAEAFVSRHPWARDVRVVLNFEARGNRGPVQMFETSPGNGAVVGAWAESVPQPAGTSLAYEIYRRLPNDTDFTEFKRLDAIGLNFACIENVESYHTPGDSAEHLDGGSLQAHGDTALSLARRFGNAALDLSAWRGRDAVFFSLPGGRVARYSTLWCIPLAALAVVVWVWLAIRARRRGQAKARGILVVFVVIAAFLGLGVWGSLKITQALLAVQNWIQPVAAPLVNSAYAFGLAAAALCLWLGLYVTLRRKLAAHTVALASLVPVLVGSAALAYSVPGASYLATWPLLAGLASTLMLPSGKRTGSTPALSLLALIVLAVPAVAILTPTVTTLFAALGLEVSGAAAMVVLVWGALSMLGPHIEVIVEGRRAWPAVLAGLLAVGALAAGVATAPHNAAHPRPENVVYALDADGGRAMWATTADPPGTWLETFVTKTPRRGPLTRFLALAGQTQFVSSEAAVIETPAPVVSVVRTSDEDGGRLLTVRVVSPRQARACSLRVPDRDILDVRVNGRAPGDRSDTQGWAAGRWGLEFSNLPVEGVEVTVRVRGTKPVTFIVIDRSDGLPAPPGFSLAPRPPSSMPIHRGDVTIVQKTYTF